MGQSRVTATRARPSEPLGSGASEKQHPATPTLPSSCVPSALQLTGVWACLCVRRSVRVSCGLGGHVRDRHRCHEGEYTLVSSRFTKTAHPACPHVPQWLWASQTVQSPNSAPQILHPTAKRHICPEMGNPEPRAATQMSMLPTTPTLSRDIMQVGPDCEGGGLHGRQESSFGPAM